MSSDVIQWANRGENVVWDDKSRQANGDGGEGKVGGKAHDIGNID